MPSGYPGSLDALPTNRADGTSSATNHPTDHNDANDAINKIEAELGTDPAGAVATVKARLEAIEARALAQAGVYRPLLTGSGSLSHDAAAGTRFLVVTDGFAPSAQGSINRQTSPRNIIDASSSIAGIYLHATSLGVSGLNTKLRVRAHVGSNGTDPNIDLTIGLYPITFSGAADVLTVTAGTLVSNSGAAITNANLGTNDSETAASADFNVPTDGPYALAVVSSATLANNAALQIMAALELHHVAP